MKNGETIAVFTNGDERYDIDTANGSLIIHAYSNGLPTWIGGPYRDLKAVKEWMRIRRPGARLISQKEQETRA